MAIVILLGIWGQEPVYVDEHIKLTCQMLRLAERFLVVELVVVKHVAERPVVMARSVVEIPEPGTY